MTPSKFNSPINGNIHADDFKRNVSHYLDRVTLGDSFVITRKNKEFGLLAPFSAEEKTTDVLCATELSRKLGQILGQTKAGRRFIIERNRTKIAILIPPDIKHKEALTDEQIIKLLLIDGLSVETVRKFVANITETINSEPK
jgi:hypothetical protein